MSDSSSQVRGFEWLRLTGSAYTDRIKAEHPLFLSDIPVDDQQLDALFTELSRFGCAHLSDEGRACLAVAAIGSAVHASEQDTGFREQFFRRLGMDLNPDWDYVYGPQILRFLMDYFDEVDRPGPFRFVRAIYRHAGISHRALPAFARFLRDLRNRNGFDYTNWQYRQLLDKVASRFARDFLNTDAGYEFTQAVTRILEDVEKGRMPVGQLDDLPGFRKGFWTALLEYLGDRPGNQRKRRNLPIPVLALDLIGQRLVLRFDEDGIARRSYTMNGRQPIYPYERIRRGGRISGSIFHPSGDTEPWELDPWVPTKTPWALFRGSDGAFVAEEGRVSPGSYYLVAEDSALPSDIVEEDCGCLDWESHDLNGQPYRIWRILLRPGTQIESIGLEASTADTIPSLEYVGLPRESEFGAEVFIDRLPPIRVKNWTESSSKFYRILLDTERGPEEIDQRIRDGHLYLAIESPAVGRISIEPRGRVRHSVLMLPELRFHVIPGPLRFQFPKVAIGENDSAEVCLVSPRKWEIEWKDSLVELGPRRWAIPPRTRVIEGTATLEGYGVPIALRVKRCSLSIFPTSGVPNVFWSEDSNENVQFLIEGVPDAACSLLLVTENDSITLCYLGILGPSGLATIRSLEFRDYLLQSSIPCAEFAVFAGKQVVRTGQFLLAAKHIPKLLQSVDNECPYFGIPIVGATLRAIWLIYRAPQTEVELEPRLMESHLGRLLADMALTATVLDATKINLSADQLRPFATPGLLKLLDSIQAVQAPQAEMSCTDIPNVDVNLVPLHRWRESVTLLIEQQRDLKDAPAIVREWRSEICSEFQVEYQSRMCRRKGGGDLTQAAIKYRAAVMNSNERAYDAAYGTLRRLVEEKPDLLVKAVALGLLQLTLYRSARRREAGELSASNLPNGFARLGAEMNALAALCRGGVCPEGAFPSGVGFEDLSPIEEDRQLFDESNRLVEGILRKKREGSA
jgi:hypothetical protein